MKQRIHFISADNRSSGSDGAFPHNIIHDCNQSNSLDEWNTHTHKLLAPHPPQRILFYVSMSVCSLCFFLFLHSSFFHLAVPPLHPSPLIYVAEEQLSRAGRKVGQAGRPAAGSAELEHWAHCLTRTLALRHSPLTRTQATPSHPFTSIWKARRERVGSWAHINWASIEVH